MLTKTIGQLSAAAAIDTADYLEIEHSGASRKTSIGSVGTLIADTERPYATSAESAAGSSNTAILTPATFRAGINAENEAPIYACRAWVNFDGTSVSSSLSGTYTRAVGTTLTVCVATAHGMITGNVQYIDFVTGGGSDNSYIVTVTDEDTFTVSTVSTSSILSSTLSLKRCPIRASGNISNVSRSTTGTYFINFTKAMPSAFYGISGSCGGLVGSPRIVNQNITGAVPNEYSCKIESVDTAGALQDTPFISIQVFA